MKRLKSGMGLGRVKTRHKREAASASLGRPVEAASGAVQWDEAAVSTL